MNMGETEKQLTLRLERGMSESYASCREFV